MTTTATAPDVRTFRAHVADGAFIRGVARGRWRLVAIDWPHAIIAVGAAPRAGSPDAYAFRFELTNYPAAAPTARLWDFEQQQPLALDRWPTGRTRVPMAFRPEWLGGESLYLPCDRRAIVGHDAWRTQHPAMIWSATSDITLYLSILHELLTSHDYTGSRRGTPGA